MWFRIINVSEFVLCRKENRLFRFTPTRKLRDKNHSDLNCNEILIANSHKKNAFQIHLKNDLCFRALNPDRSSKPIETSLFPDNFTFLNSTDVSISCLLHRAIHFQSTDIDAIDFDCKFSLLLGLAIFEELELIRYVRFRHDFNFALRNFILRLRTVFYTKTRSFNRSLRS